MTSAQILFGANTVNLCLYRSSSVFFLGFRLDDLLDSEIGSWTHPASMSVWLSCITLEYMNYYLENKDNLKNGLILEMKTTLKRKQTLKIDDLTMKMISKVKMILKMKITSIIKAT